VGVVRKYNMTPGSTSATGESSPPPNPGPDPKLVYYRRGALLHRGAADGDLYRVIVLTDLRFLPEFKRDHRGGVRDHGLSLGTDCTRNSSNHAALLRLAASALANAEVSADAVRVLDSRTHGSLTGAGSSRQHFSFDCGEVDSSNRRLGCPGGDDAELKLAVVLSARCRAHVSAGRRLVIE
jgi:hypothetical protein